MTILRQTERLSLREADVHDAPFLLDLMNQPDWLKFIGDRGIRSLDDAEKYIADKLQTSYSNYGFGLLIMERQVDKSPLGLCGLLKRPQLAFPDIGFAIHAQYYGCGYAFEAAEAIVEVAKEKCLGRLLAITDPANARSIHLLKKIGLREEGLILLDPEGTELLLFGREIFPV
jgi:[ribosomal protein S5]-alanine N-acetyltransferase